MNQHQLDALNEWLRYPRETPTDREITTTLITLADEGCPRGMPAVEYAVLMLAQRCGLVEQSGH